ncbi:hypothetical protein SAMN05216412_102188 [Nitrosospira multiformis]|uniref:Uncharacterized protein n=1 Tax=Nitrosospira multiformis TaxID=1231 RepID=A0A1I0ADC5_9PROT|nr:hypothetical protein [Nitrosospira multiformis]SES91699.1 hypothetical protein SAMN05216412_102188 [Nitrosospira multiformis]
MTEVKTDSEANTIDICVHHAREILASQLLQVKDKGYDFAPLFRQMTIQLYLVGVMWRCSERLGVAGDTRDHAFEAMQSMLIADGMKKKEAQQRIVFLRNMSRVEDGTDTLAVSTGYEAVPNDNSMTRLFDEYRNEARVSGSLWRLFERGKKIMFIGGAAAAFVTIWAVTIFLPKTEGIDILAAGLLAAALVVVPTFLIGLLIYRTKMKKSIPPASSQS